MQQTLIALDNYDDIFSDFDIGPYEARRISTDFIEELWEKTKKNIPAKIILTLPAKERNKDVETGIKRRLKDFFKKKAESKKNKASSYALRGAFLIIVGIALYFLLLFLGSSVERIYDYALFPSWYISWKGLDFIFHALHLRKLENYYRAIMKAEIAFEDEEKFSTEQKITEQKQEKPVNV
jgi:hypothetical protein